ncbi:MAG TPA: hypothetical protein VMD53_02440 [Rhizomicrobium sp.]|nr:hypothetical protein [Rhizomicrobium sp.]
MLNISNTLKSAALAGVLGVAAIAVGTSTAAARTYTDCDGDTCVRMHCDAFGDNCWRESVYYNPSYRDFYHDDYYNYDRGTYGGFGHYSCDAFGDNCRWIPE